MKGLSDWQLSRVRNALRAYHRYERLSALRTKQHYEKQVAKAKELPDHTPHLRLDQRDRDDFYFTWKDVRAAIAVYTGVKIGTSLSNGAERLRSFVEGEMKKGVRRLPEPKLDALEAIIAFLTHEDFNLLTEDEMQEYMPGVQAPLRLLEYLEQKFDTERLTPPESLEGVYETRKIDEGDLIIRELTMYRPSKSGFVQVMEIEDVYDEEIASKFESLSRAEQRAERNNHIKYGGWAVLTPECNLLFFMKEVRTGMNRYYFTLASDITRKLDTPMNKMVLLHHDYPFEQVKGRIQGMDEMITALMEELPDNLLGFERRKDEPIQAQKDRA